MQEFDSTKKPFIRRFWWIGLVIILGLGVTWLLMAFVVHPNKNNKNENSTEKNINSNNKIIDGDKTSQDKPKFAWPSTTEKYITSVPVDLTQVQSISKYRSCAGHDRSGYTFAQVLEENRSMKHYFYPIPAYQGTLDKVKMFAPFDGTVSQLSLEKDKVGGRLNGGNGIDFSTIIDPNAVFGFGHIYFVKDFKVGDKVTAGELIGYAALGDKGMDFDIDLKAKEYYGINESSHEVLDSAFDHMTIEVLAEFAKYGVTTENTKISKEIRDTNPCNFADQQDDRTGSGWIQLK